MTAAKIRNQLRLNRVPGLPDYAVTATAIERTLRAYEAFR